MDNKKLASLSDIRRFALVWEQMYINHKNIPYDFFEDSFFIGESMMQLGFEMDCGNSFKNAFPDVELSSDDLTSWKNILKEIDLMTLGNALFSQWRWFNHWNEAEIKENDFEWFTLGFARLAELSC